VKKPAPPRTTKNHSTPAAITACAIHRMGTRSAWLRRCEAASAPAVPSSDTSASSGPMRSGASPIWWPMTSASAHCADSTL